ncbi:nitroreductase [Dysgonomonadaceae bacterium PH5-43]|nr:nitroreductase [Dysgonomonadaceae bacterium PH5-43]
MMSIIETIKQRKSVRTYTGVPLSEELKAKTNPIINFFSA